MLKRIFNDKEISYKKIIIFAIIIGIYTGIISLIQPLRETSFCDISISFEWWILFGIIIIYHSKAPKESMLKVFLFFLISQPIIYLVQVPFVSIGFKIFEYYKLWFILTLLTIPMGYVGYDIKKENIWSVIILSSMLIFLSAHLIYYINIFIHNIPNHLLTIIICITEIIILILGIFKNKKERFLSFIITIISIIIFSITTFNNNLNYNTMIDLSEYEIEIDSSWNISVSDNSISTAYITYSNNKYLISVHFKKTGTNTITIKDNTGKSYQFLISADKNYNVDIVEDN